MSDDDFDLWDDEDTDEEAPPEPVFGTVEEFVVDYLAPMVARRLNGVTLTWCPDWWLHAEAISRLNAMWRAWENLRLDPALGMSTWWIHHADPQLHVLMDPDNGPFSACSPIEGHSEHPPQPLPTNPADPRMWLGTAFSTTAAAERIPED
ncbi:DUF4913 domain-containing protein [Kitasatospora sp. NPDC093550]|uniref:DUF4913 domain-containing protein n=1 Tax=Kitasatospora sp. NPDC093550 TaxID=3364089 RepID=UPI00380CAC05